MNNLASRSSTGIIAVIGAWLLVLPSSVTNLAMLLDGITRSNTSAYSLVLGFGWLVFVTASSLFGNMTDSSIGDWKVRKTAIKVATTATLLLSFALSVANQFNQVFFIWIALQIPVALILCIAQTFTAEQIRLENVHAPSGFLGGAPLISILAGTILLAISGTSHLIFLLLAGVGTLLLAPMYRHLNTSPAAEIARAETTPKSTQLNALWRRFLTASFLLACASASTNSYIVAYCTDVLHKGADESLQLVTTTVLAASLISIISGLIAVRRTRSTVRVFRAWSLGALITGLSIGLLISIPSTLTLVLCALGFGIGFGISNGQELHIVKIVHNDSGKYGTALGSLAAVTSLPYILIPLFGAALYGSDIGNPLQVLWGTGSFVAFIGGALINKQTSHNTESH